MVRERLGEAVTALGAAHTPRVATEERREDTRAGRQSPSLAASGRKRRTVWTRRRRRPDLQAPTPSTTPH
eukprot:11888027-Alexandrium_andersonii.AAC.1